MSGFIKKWKDQNWTVGQYTPSDNFKQIQNHSCVCLPDKYKSLVSLSGPAEDLESQALSDLVSQAPKLYLLLEHLFMNTRLEVTSEMNDEIRETLRKARGEGMKSVADYLNYVHACLDSIPEDAVVKASYDTGYGIHIVDQDLGNGPMTVFVVQHSVCKVKPPESGIADWDEAWRQGKDLIHKFIDKRGGI